jgi:hypothetical protein
MAGRRVRKIHGSLTGTDADGTVFRLDEPEQLLWVHCAGVDSYVNICRRCGMDATPAQRDAFVAEQGRSAALVGLDPAEAPASVVELNAYYADTRRRARASAEAKKSLLMSFNPPVTRALMPLKLAAPAVNTLVFAALPRWARKLCGAPGTVLTDAATTAALRGLYQATRPVPARLSYTATVCNPGRSSANTSNTETQQTEPGAIRACTSDWCSPAAVNPAVPDHQAEPPAESDRPERRVRPQSRPDPPPRSSYTHRRWPSLGWFGELLVAPALSRRRRGSRRRLLADRPDVIYPTLTADGGHGGVQRTMVACQM